VVIKIAKTELTLELEKNLRSSTSKKGLFGCFEVTIGFNGDERVAYITYDTKGIWRCYEIKVFKADFHSKASKTFVGHYNYYVMPKELYDKVKDEIPKHIGVHNGNYCLKNAKKEELQVDVKILKDSLIRSLCRDAEKVYTSESVKYIKQLKSQISRLEKESKEWRKDYYDLYNKVRELYGRNWDKSDISFDE
jgi:hypothetical protein